MTSRYTIAITGKGGTGKTTIAALMVTSLIRKGLAPVLAVDADPNSCLDTALGVKVEKTVGRIREESRDAASASTSGISKHELVEMRIAQSLVESVNFDLIAMGRPEGPGCYCYANNLFSDVINRLSDNYPVIVIDNEAGLENLSRRLYKSIDLLIIAGDPSMRGTQTMKRLFDLAGEMGIVYERLALVVNLMRSPRISEASQAVMDGIGPDYRLFLPFDEELAALGETGGPMQGLGPANQVMGRISAFIEGLNIKGK